MSSLWEEEGCLRFWNGAGGLQSTMGTWCGASTTVFSSVTHSDTLALNLGIRLKVLEKQSRTSNRSPGQYNKSSHKHNYPDAVSERSHLKPVQVFLPNSVSCHVGDSSYLWSSGYEHHLTSMMKTPGYRQGWGVSDTGSAGKQPVFLLISQDRDGWRPQPAEDGHVVSVFLIKDVLREHGSWIYTYAITRFNLYEEPLCQEKSNR